MIEKIRYIVHPEDEVKLAVMVGEGYDEIRVLFDLEGKEPFITQVHDRLTIADEGVRLDDEYVNHPLDEV